jgi:hypothetical protein
MLVYIGRRSVVVCRVPSINCRRVSEVSGAWTKSASRRGGLRTSAVHVIKVTATAENTMAVRRRRHTPQWVPHQAGPAGDEQRVCLEPLPSPSVSKPNSHQTPITDCSLLFATFTCTVPYLAGASLSPPCLASTPRSSFTFTSTS